MTKDDVRVKVGGDTKGLKSSLDESRRMISQFSRVGGSALAPLNRALGGTLQSIFSVRGAITTLAGTGGLGLLVTRSLQAADEIAKMADRTGLGIEALQELRHAADLSGIGADAFGRSMERLNVAIGEAARGTGAARDGFKMAGIELRDVAGRVKNNETVFLELADAVAQTEDATRRADIVNRVFGQRLGSQLLPLFKQGAEGIAQMRKEARDMGLVLDSVMVREAEKARDQLTRLGRIVGNNLTRAMLSLAPTIVAVGKAFSAAAPAIARWVSTLLPATVAPVEELERRLEALREQEQLLQDQLQGRNTGPALGGAPVASARQEEIAAVRAEIEALNGFLEARRREEELLASALDFSTDAHKDHADSVEKVTAAQLAGQNVAAAWRERQSQAASIFEATRTPLEKYRAEIDKLNALLGEGMISQETYRRAIEQAQQTFEDSGRKAGEAARAVGQLDRANQDLARTLTAATGQALRGNMQDWSDWGDFAVNQITRVWESWLQAQLAASSSSSSGGGGLLGSIFSTGVGLLGSIVSGGGGLFSIFGSGIATAFANAGGAIPGALPGFVPGLTPRAGGGPVTAGQPYLVGERGPELMVPRTSGTVIPAPQTAAALGGVQVAVKVVNNTTSHASAQARRGAGGDIEVEVMLDEMVGRNIRRGGNTAEAIRALTGASARPVTR